jgi:hypothetical protein
VYPFGNRQVVLMLWLGFPERPRRSYLGDDLQQSPALDVGIVSSARVASVE